MPLSNGYAIRKSDRGSKVLPTQQRDATQFGGCARTLDTREGREWERRSRGRGETLAYQMEQVGESGGEEFRPKKDSTGSTHMPK
jgi:hypothetical protein